ncbi:MAG: hypothetical protein LBQ60_02560 [Bacteroidales bacterium]|jgi:hypothetical protein|nr:hypothetical protein [Bacteroidales bacterium]
MEKELQRFFINMLVLLILIISVSQLLFSVFFETYDFPGRILCIGFIWLVTCVSYYWLMKTVVKHPKSFNRIFMLQTSLKLFLYLISIVVYLLLFKGYALQFVALFLVTYLIFAIFEVVSILKFVKKDTGTVSGGTKTSNKNS